MTVSVVVPVYNDENHLETCIKSIISQDYPKLEIILVNDGSSDNSLHIIEFLKKEDARIKIINQPNRGTYLARKNGYDIANGDYILTLDADDFLEPEAISNLVNTALETHADIVLSDFYLHRNGGKRLVKNLLPLKQDAIEPIRFLLLGKIHVHIWGRLIKTSLVKAIELPVKRAFSEDVLFNFYLLSRPKLKLAHSNSVTINYLIRDDNISLSTASDIKEGFFNEFEIVEDLLNKKGFKEEVVKELAFYKCNLWLSYCRKKGQKAMDPIFHKAYFRKYYPYAKDILPIYLKIELLAYRINFHFGYFISTSTQNIKKLLRY